MMICAKCGNELAQDANFCTNCGAQIVVTVEEPVVEATPVTTPVVESESVAPKLSDEEKGFIENTRRLLRWEKKAWKITGIAFTVMGGLFGGLFLLFSIIFFAIGNYDMVTLGIIYAIYAFIYGALFLGLGIIQLVAAGKISYYLKTIDNDFTASAKRCGSIGMMIFAGLCGSIPVIFFAINFARIKSSGKTIEKIVAYQKEI